VDIIRVPSNVSTRPSSLEFQGHLGDQELILAAPEHIPLLPALTNPSVPYSLSPSTANDSSSPLLAHHQRTSQTPSGHLVGSGPERTFVAAWEGGEALHGYPSRPLPGLVMDLDTMLERCDFGTYKVSSGLEAEV
jgi:WD repeat and SOF domain-containing protein 1